MARARPPSARTGAPTPRRPRVRSRAGPTEDWRGATLSHLREVIVAADPEAIEERKWKMPSKPAGVPVWSHDGILCMADTLKNAVRLTFPKGARIPDPDRLFNARRDSRTVRAIDVHDGETIDAAALRAIVREAVALNASRERAR